jgi:hypothetical protein
MKPKEWLKQNGHIADANVRGRLSLAHKALIEEAVSNGVVIDGYSLVKEKPATATKEATAPTVERTAVAGKVIADIGDPTRDERSMSAFWVKDGKNLAIGMREICNLCGNSLTYCFHQIPQVNRLDSPVPVTVQFKNTA